MGSNANYQQAPVHWPREITKAKLSQAKPLFIHIFSLKQCKHSTASNRTNKSILSTSRKIGLKRGKNGNLGECKWQRKGKKKLLGNANGKEKGKN